MADYKPEEVFTPRSSQVNDRMYIHRSTLEKAIVQATRVNKHIIIHGESGSGKSWLYKKVLSENNINYYILNSGTIKTTKSVEDSLNSLAIQINPKIQTGYKETKEAMIGAFGSGAKLDQTKEYYFVEDEPFLRCLKTINNFTKGKLSYIVIENFEHVVKRKELIEELSGILLKIDDENYSKYNTRIIIVGTPSNIRQYLAEAEEGITLINRLLEIPEVTTLSDNQVESLVRRGFFEILGYKLIPNKESKFDIDEFISSIIWFSANIPQYIHDICLNVAFRAQDADGNIDNDCFYQGIVNWLRASLVAEHAVLEYNLNSIKTKIGRRNQIIYSLCTMGTNEFDYQEAEKRLRSEFPISTKNKTLNVSGMLSEICDCDHPILRKSPKGTRYRFVDPKVKIMARWMLNKSDDETITIKSFDDSIKW